MKYTSRADLLIAAVESIKMQERAGIDPVFKHRGTVIKFEGAIIQLDSSSEPTKIELPLAVIEGKPVFVWDELYTPCTGKQKVTGANPSTLEFADGSYELRMKCSWNPPKPKTVMVELLREDAEYWASYDVDYAHIGCAPSKYKTASENFYKSVRKALEK